MYVVDIDWGEFLLRVMNVTWTDIDSLAFIFHFFNNPWIGFRLVGGSVKQWLDHCPWLPQYRRQMLLLKILLRLVGLQCTAVVTVATGHCLAVHPH
jgi:hypothetical protein